MFRAGILLSLFSCLLSTSAPSCQPFQFINNPTPPADDGQSERPSPDQPVVPAKPQVAAPLSRHYVEVVFDKATGSEAESPTYYHITGPNSGVLAVKSARISADRTRVILNTGTQDEVLYSLRVGEGAGGDPAVFFQGSLGAEPYVTGAVALDNTTVLVTFSEAMDGNAAFASQYRVEPELAVLTAARASENTIMLRTAAQAKARYTVSATNISARGTKLIDTSRNSAVFDGIPPKDDVSPRLLSALSLNDSKVVLSFNEPLGSDSLQLANFSISPSLTVTEAAFSVYDTQIVLTTIPQQVATQYTVTAAGSVRDKSGNGIDPDHDTATFAFDGQIRLEGANKLPRVVGAISTGNTSVRVAFSKIMGSGLTDKLNYSITGSDSRFLSVISIDASADKTYVDITTSSQSAGMYTVKVVNVKDAQGNPMQAPSGPLAPPDGVDPAAATFAGTPPASPAQQVDTDRDGLPDAVETAGWFVTVKLANGAVQVYHVTSNPQLKDTDGDGLTDAEEKNLVYDPRSTDTDGDMISDYDEFNVWYSDGADQDTDDDGTGDWLEIMFYQTSAILKDTDGDQLSDTVELLERNRNPLVADLPLPQITVDDVRLGVKVVSSYTDEQGKTQSVTDNTSTTFTQSRSETLGTSDTTSTESENSFSQKIGLEVSYGVKDGWGGKASAEAGFGQKRTQGFSSTVNRETAKASQQEYAKSVERALESSQRRAVTRNIEEASIQANVNIRNKSDIAFTITNLEISVQQQDRRNSRRFRPIATLRPSGASDPTNQPKYNLGPFDPERGPIIFDNVTVFPNLVDDLMREPTGLIFQVVNFDILDEFGRNFVFSSQEVNDRTVGITIDFGNGDVEQYRVATTSTFDGDGKPVGIPMERALQILSLALVPDDPPYVRVDPVPLAIRKSYGTQTDSNGVERLVRVRGVQNDLIAVPEAEKRFWAVVTSNLDLEPDTNFSGIQVFAGDDYLLMFTRDIDKDGLYEREEYLYGSDDRSVDTDADGLGDYFEVRTGWTVAKKPGLPYKTFSDPARADSDDDSLLDSTEYVMGTDPNRSDTDEDGLPDGAEVSPEGFEFVLFDGDADDTNDKFLRITPYSSWAIIDGGNGICNTTAAGDDVQAVSVGSAATPGDVVILPGPNGVLDTTPAGDDIAAIAEEIVNGPDATCQTVAEGDDIQVVPSGGAATSGQVLIRAGINGKIDTTPGGDDYVRVKHAGLFTTDPLNIDTDGDGLPDGRELLIGTNPNRRDAGSVIDSDRDGLYDDEEDAGWLITVYNSSGTPTTRRVTSNKFRADTDLDGVPDVYERAIKSDPRLADTDGDTLFDRDEFDPADTDRYYDAAALAQAVLRCGQAENCVAPAAPDLAERLRTNVFKKDSDGDGRDDNVELNTSWTINVVGKDPYQAFSKPYAADADSDGLNDAQELAAGTDPNMADTDEDALTGVSGTDSYEISVGRNPLRKDQLITFTYTHVVVIDNCEGTADESGEFYGNLYITFPGASTRTNVYACSNCCQVNSSGECEKNVSRSFAINQGQSFTASSDQWYEDDTTGDDQVGSFTQTFTYPTTATTGTFELTGGDRCINIKYSIVTQ